MATIQSKMSRGHKYWYIVESRRVNGKPRPVVLEYLGKAENLLTRLNGLNEGIRVKSYSHGGVSALLDIGNKLEVPKIINKYILSCRSYHSEKPIRHHLTAGMTFLLGAIGRVCKPTSKSEWSKWVKETSCEYLLKENFSKIHSQHFWDLMDTLPVENIEKIERELLKKVKEVYQIESDTILYDTTNFYTFIDSKNNRCSIAKRGKNKQKRTDLRQVGLAMVVTGKDYIPLFHHTYEGNMNDAKVFKGVIKKIKNQIVYLGFNIESHTLIFDRGSNSKENLKEIKKLNLHYVGALTPCHHKELIQDAVSVLEQVDVLKMFGGNLRISWGWFYNEVNKAGIAKVISLIGQGYSVYSGILTQMNIINSYQGCDIDGKKMEIYRDKREIWGEDRTVIVFVSDKLKTGQIKGIYQSLNKIMKTLQELNNTLLKATKKRNKKQIQEQIEHIIKKDKFNLTDYELLEPSEGKFNLTFSINQKHLEELEDELGFRILMTNRHDWQTPDIIKSFYSQSTIENTFKNIKNPNHLSISPQFHWTDQKIRVHYFICVVGYLLAAILWRQARLKADFRGSLNSLLDLLNSVRLSTLLEKNNTRGRVKTIHKLEELTDEQTHIMKALKIDNFHVATPKFDSVGVYNDDHC